MRIVISVNYATWEPWFAWFPVCVRHAYEVRDGARIYDRWEWVWLQRVERRKVYIPALCSYEYRIMLRVVPRE